MIRKKSVLVMVLISTLLITSMTVDLTSSRSYEHSWPFQGQNLRSTGRSPVGTSHIDGTVKWNHTLPRAIGVFSPVVDEDNNVYMTSEPFLYAFDSEGELRWNSSADQHVSTTPAIGPDGTVYAGGGRGEFYAFDSEDGDLLWSTNIDSKIRSSPIVTSRNEIYFGSDAGVFYALDGNQGGLTLWTYEVEQPDEEHTIDLDIFGSPAIDGDTVYFGSFDEFLYALDRNDGSLKWRYMMNSQVVSSPAVGDDGTIYVGDVDGLVALSPEGNKRWFYQVVDEEDRTYPVMGSPSIGEDGTIYFGSQDNNIYALYPDGRFKWNILTDSYIYSSSPAICADGNIYIGSLDTVFYAVNENREVRWHHNTTGGIDSSPAIGPDGTVYIANVRGELIAFTSGEETTDSDWLIIGSIVGIIAAVSVVFVYKKYQEIS